MVNINIVLETKTVHTPDAEHRIKSAWRILAEMVLSLAEGERDSEQAPVELPQESVGQPSPTKNTAIIET